jgi:hypothetical protein
MKRLFLILTLTGFFVHPIHGKKKSASLSAGKNSSKSFITLSRPQQILLKQLQVNPRNKQQIEKVRKAALKMGGRSVPVLMSVMQNDAYPDRSRWVATFLIAQIMGKKSKKFLAKNISHPHWLIRMASLKSLQMLGAKEFQKSFETALFDNAMVVRSQALQTIERMQFKNSGAAVLRMLEDEKNYREIKGVQKRTSIVSKIIRVLGNLKFLKAKGTFLTLIKDQKNNDIFYQLNTSLEKITGLKAPKGSREQKRKFWVTVAKQ